GHRQDDNSHDHCSALLPKANPTVPINMSQRRQRKIRAREGVYTGRNGTPHHKLIPMPPINRVCATSSLPCNKQIPAISRTAVGNASSIHFNHGREQNVLPSHCAWRNTFASALVSSELRYWKLAIFASPSTEIALRSASSASAPTRSASSRAES